MTIHLSTILKVTTRTWGFKPMRVNNRDPQHNYLKNSKRYICQYGRLNEKGKIRHTENMEKEQNDVTDLGGHNLFSPLSPVRT